MVNGTADHGTAVMSDAEFRLIERTRSHAKAEGTRKLYNANWRRFSNWLDVRGTEDDLPVDSGLVALYLLECAKTFRFNTLETIAYAIGDIHQRAGYPSPIREPGVTEMMNGLRREKRDERVHQAAALTKAGLEAIIVVAYDRRPMGRGRETVETARRRGDMDVAIVHTLFDGMLRISELVALEWGDVERASDGMAGVVCIRASKTDQVGRGAYVWLSPDAMYALNRIRDADAGPRDRIFPMDKNTVIRRMRRMGETAGLGTELTGHSARIGMTRELVKAGIHIVLIMQAGRWSSSEMVPYYNRAMLPAEGAVPLWYRKTKKVVEEFRIYRAPIAVRHPDFVGI